MEIRVSVEVKKFPALDFLGGVLKVLGAIFLIGGFVGAIIAFIQFPQSLKIWVALGFVVGGFVLAFVPFLYAELIELQLAQYQATERTVGFLKGIISQNKKDPEDKIVLDFK